MSCYGTVDAIKPFATPSKTSETRSPPDVVGEPDPRQLRVVDTGVDVVITISTIFRQLSAKKIGDVSKTDVKLNFSPTNGCTWFEAKPPFFPAKSNDQNIGLRSGPRLLCHFPDWVGHLVHGRKPLWSADVEREKLDLYPIARLHCRQSPVFSDLCTEKRFSWASR
jgi:hypothetical protein